MGKGKIGLHPLETGTARRGFSSIGTMQRQLLLPPGVCSFFIALSIAFFMLSVSAP